MAYLSCFRPPSCQASENGPRSLDSRLVTFDSRPQPQGLLSKTVIQSISRPLSLDVQNIGLFGTSIMRRLSQFKRVTRQPNLGAQVLLSSVTSCADETPPRVHISLSLDHPRFNTRLRTPYPWRGDECPYQDVLKGEGILRQRLRMTGEHAASLQKNSFYHPFPTLSRYSGCAEFEPYAEWLTDHLLCNIVSNSAFTQPEYLTSSHMHKILDILDYYRPKAAVIFLSLYYLSRLFPRAIMSSHNFDGAEAVELVARIFLLGLFLAGRWLDDFFYHKNSSWRRFCSLLCASVNALQKSALVSLDYNLTISNADWETWMLGLIRARSQRKFPRQGMATLVAALCEVLSVTRSSYGGETFTSKTPASPDRLGDLHTQILAGLIDSEKGPSRPAANPSEIVCTTSRLA